MQRTDIGMVTFVTEGDCCCVFNYEATSFYSESLCIYMRWFLW